MEPIKTNRRFSNAISDLMHFTSCNPCFGCEKLFPFCDGLYEVLRSEPPQVLFPSKCGESTASFSSIMTMIFQSSSVGLGTATHWGLRTRMSEYRRVTGPIGVKVQKALELLSQPAVLHLTFTPEQLESIEAQKQQQGKEYHHEYGKNLRAELRLDPND
ncbi:unnamed protein product [Clonostachys rosea]|uniref:Uncharacterized protein n=1 Tax=Bionectria ochroleuca TaxID=29856 RepID=A0ABY6UNJ7_BIOOC|nr:unnamed protein product [Clonostachys rosea]